MKWPRLFILICLLGGSVTAVWAQETIVTVPDLANLNIPQAAAALNAVGLRLGTETNTLWSMASGIPANTIGSQSIAPGTEVAAGTAVDVEILRSPNVTLIYDDNDITFVNRATSPLLLNRIKFQALNTATPISHTANGIAGRDRVNSGDCGQFWSITDRRSAKELPECHNVYWRATRQADKHFWTQSNGVQEFAVLQDGQEIARCPAAGASAQNNPLRCDFFTLATAETDFTSYTYLAYTTEAIVLINPTNDRWMRTRGTTIYNLNPQVGAGTEVIMGAAELYDISSIVAHLWRLAPGQCLLMTTNESAALPQACHPIAQLSLTPAVAFWLFNFDILSGSDNERRTCPAATEGRVTLCIMPW